MPFEIVMRNDVSFSQLVALQKSGVSVVKSPHVGNMYLNNLACAHLGIPMLLVDHTIGAKDRNFHPHCAIVRGAAHRIADETCLTTHSRVESVPEICASWFSVGASVAHCHSAAIQQATPSANLVEYSRYMRAHAEQFLALLEVCTETAPGSWERGTLPTGVVRSMPPVRTWRGVLSAGIAGLTGYIGHLPPNAFNIIADGMMEAAASGLPYVYHLSGPDMFRYIGTLQPLLSTLYDAARLRLGWRLPEMLVFNLVPVADMRLAVLSSNAPALDELVEAYHALKSVEYETRLIMRTAGIHEKDALIGSRNAIRGAHLMRLQEAITACDDNFYDITEARFISQYDMLMQNEHVYIHPWAMETPLAEISVLMKYLFSMRKK